MYTAARNFEFGVDGESLVFKIGDEVPDEVAENEEVPRHLILEYLADENPDALTRDQLMALAGVGRYAEDGEGDEDAEIEFDKEAFQAALDEFPNVGALIEWAEEIYPELKPNGKRAEIEAQILAYASGEEEE